MENLTESSVSIKKSKLYKWLRSEKGMILWTTGVGIIAGLIYANNGPSPFPSVKWWGSLGSGMATLAILSSVLNRYVIAVNREKSGETTKDIHALVVKSEALISRRETLLEIEGKIEQFKQFLRRESYHNIRFPLLKSDHNSMGLEYTIRPVRDPDTNEPVKYETEMSSAYLVYVQGPAHIEVMSKERIKDYEDSPIRDGEYAFCKFLNDSWHLGFESFPGQYEFYLSGKVGPVEHGQTANQFMKAMDDRFKDKTLVTSLLLKEDGTLMTGLGGCYKYEIYKDSSDALYLKIGESLPKPMYYTQPKNTWGDHDWFLLIENIRGYAGGEKLKNIVSSIETELKRLQVEPKKIKWYQSKVQLNQSDN